MTRFIALRLTTTLGAGGTSVSNNAFIQLIKNPNPFILHGDVGGLNLIGGNISLRVAMLSHPLREMP